jgi:phage terminase large subunit
MMSANDPPVEWTVADPESRDGRLLLARECNISTKPAHKAVLDGINSVKERLSLDANGKPHLLIHDNCKELIREFRLYRWSEGAGKDRPIKKYDHGLDALRYQVVLLQKYMRHL